MHPCCKKVCFPGVTGCLIPYRWEYLIWFTEFPALKQSYYNQEMRLKSNLILLLVALVWGSGFVSQRLAASNGLGIFLFNGFRFTIGGLVLLPFTLKKWNLKPAQLPWVALAGVLLFLGSALQQAGIRYTTAANAGFITSLYVVIVPLLLSMAWKQRIRGLAWTAALLAAAGAWLLSGGGQFSLSKGDSLELLGAFLWAAHVILVGYLTKQVDVFQFAVSQNLVAGFLHLILGFTLEGQTLPALNLTWMAVLYNGLFSIAAGFTLQMVGQRHSPPGDAAILLSMEAVFAALFGYLFLSEGLSAIQIMGCGLIMAAILIAQVRQSPLGDPGQSSPAAEAETG
jgi:drug/metabolite transporter (DMT)-like permease